MYVREKWLKVLVEFVDDVSENGEFIKKEIDFCKIAGSFIANGIVVRECEDIVHCVDCKHYIEDKGYCSYYRMTKFEFGFCDRGERKKKNDF